MKQTTIYVVGTDAYMTVAIRRLLRTYDFVCEIFSSTEDFIAAEKPTKDACLLLDIDRCGPNGIHMCEASRVSALELPVVILTQHEDASIRDWAKECRAVGFFHKPVDGQALVDTLVYVTEKK